MHARKLITAGSLFLLGCPGSLDDIESFRVDAGAGDGAPSCADVEATFASTCAVAGCHSTAEMSGSLDLQSPDIRGRLRGKKASGGAPLLIDPAAPDKSALYTKLLPMPPFGTRMPLGRKPLDDATARCVLLWVGGSGTVADASSD